MYLDVVDSALAGLDGEGDFIHWVSPPLAFNANLLYDARSSGEAAVSLATAMSFS